ncbi:unnamed protein product, partial [Rotaria sp. Silwood2]
MPDSTGTCPIVYPKQLPETHTPDTQSPEGVCPERDVSISSTWDCLSCTYINISDLAVCAMGNTQRTHQSTMPAHMVEPGQQNNDLKPMPAVDPFPVVKPPAIKIGKLYENPESIAKTIGLERKEEASIYICDLPADVGDTQLEQMIRQRLKSFYNIHVLKLKFYSRIEIAIAWVPSEAEKYQLLEIEETILTDHPAKPRISFVKELELVSYLAFDSTEKFTGSENEIASLWESRYKSSQKPRCEQVSMLFPNIFKIISSSIDELLAAEASGPFVFNRRFAKIYLRAECSFFENLPQDITTDHISKVVTAQIGKQQDKGSLYIQYNQEASCAIVLAAKNYHKWANVSYIVYKDQVYNKKTELTFRVVLNPIPRSISIELIVKHPIFKNAVTNYKVIGDHAIVHLQDKSVYDACLTHQGLIVQNHQICIDPYTVIVDNPENSEINARTWYETKMQGLKPDIMQFVVNPNHEIFKYKWNPQIWLDHFTSVSGINNRESDTKRRLLRNTAMLNSIGIVRKKIYTLGDGKNKKEIKLSTKPIYTVIYTHKSKLTLQRVTNTPISSPLSLTEVKVVEDDCLYVYATLTAEGYRPVLLNMANAETSGGGYRHGAAAQEENLFRRSDIYLSLDAELDDTHRTKRYWCTNDAKEKLLEANDKIYPIQEFGAIYISGITVFRDVEDKGYALLEDPLYNVNVIALPAYQQPELKHNNEVLLTGKYAAGTRKKIENFFAIAHKHGHDSLILSAFGCGAFKNPPFHIALLFKSVIEQYAGYFKTIYFAIIDDHNTGNRLNRNGNYKPFKDILDGLNVPASSKQLDVNMATGPFRVIGKDHVKMTIGEVSIFGLNPCQYGAECNDLDDEQHCRSYSHPPLCHQSDSCDQVKKDEVHKNFFIHRTKCQYGGQCKQIKDEKHLRQYDHPEYCPQASGCTDMSKTHLKNFCHLPLCKDGGPNKCALFRKSDLEHCRSFRHCNPICPFGGNCVQYHVEDHFKNHSHPFKTPCPRTPFSCQYHVEFLQAKEEPAATFRKVVEDHCSEFSHVCPFGRECTDTTKHHASVSIHIARIVCPQLDQCSMITDEEHLNSFSHPGVHDIRYLCKYPRFKCRDRSNNKHMKRYRHTGNYDHFGVAHYTGLNKRIDFVRNQEEITKAVHTYIKSENWRHSNNAIPEEITNWIRALPPVHRCSKAIFESILVHGNVMSRDYMNQLCNPPFVVNAVEQNDKIRTILAPQNSVALRSHAHEFIEVLVTIEFYRADPSKSAYLVNDEQVNKIKIKEAQLSGFLKSDEIQIIRSCAIEIARASLKLNNNPMGIAFPPDIELGTNKHVFSVLGPNRGYYYGDVFIIFKREIMHHPDANFSIQAATTYGQSTNAYRFRPWLKDPGTPQDRIGDFHRSKLHCSIPGYDNAAAIELVALSGLEKKTLNVNLSDIQKRWMSVDAHLVFEAHLPQLIPLNYIDCVYIPKNLFQSMTPFAQEVAKSIFGDRLILAPFNVNLGIEKSMDPTRIPYEKFVIDEIAKKITQNHSYSPFGTLITFPAHKFEQHVCMPITISQSYRQHQRHESQSDTIYIYLQAMGGDMMLTLSNKSVDLKDKQSNLACLICYIAEKPTKQADDTYRESCSYITCGLPYHHDKIVNHRSDMKAMSSSFHRGCNTDDFIIYCLEIKPQTGKVILKHA